MKIKFIRNVAVYSEHRENGSIHEIADKDAVMLIADRAAVRVTDEDSEPPAPAKKPAKESGK